jgi:hypothetical protein
MREAHDELAEAVLGSVNERVLGTKNQNRENNRDETDI